MYCIWVRDLYGDFLLDWAIDKGEAHLLYFLLKMQGFDAYIRYKQYMMVLGDY